MHRTDSGLIGFGPIASALWTLCLSWELYRFLARVAKDVHGVWSQSLSSNINDPLLFQSTNAGRFSRTRYKVYHAVTWVPAILLTGGTYAMASVTTTGPSGCAIQLTLLFNRTHQVLGVGSKMVTKHTRLCSPSTSPSPSVWSGVWHYMPVFVYVNTPCSSTTWESTPHAHHKRLPQNLRPHILCISLAFSASPPASSLLPQFVQRRAAQRQREGEFGSPLTSVRPSWTRQLRPLLLYPLVFVVATTPPLLNRLSVGVNSSERTCFLGAQPTTVAYT